MEKLLTNNIVEFALRVNYHRTKPEIRDRRYARCIANVHECLDMSTEPDCYTYVENGSKNNSGVNPKQMNRVVPVYAVSDSLPRCFVCLLDEYFKVSTQGI